MVYPTLRVNYNSYQVLPDQTVRIFLDSRQQKFFSSGNVIYVDVYPDSLLSQVTGRLPYLPGAGDNFAIEEFYTLFLKDGSSIIGTTQFDCDFWPPGGVFRILADTTIQWNLDFYLENDNYVMGQPVFADSGLIAIPGYLVPLFINSEGEILDIHDQDVKYTSTIETSFGYLVSAGVTLSVLDSGFTTLLTYDLSDTILNMFQQDSQRFIINTKTNHYLFDPVQHLSILSDALHPFDLMWESPSYHWGYSTVHQWVVRMDTLFTPLDTLLVPDNMEIKAGLSIQNKVMVIGQFKTYLTQSQLIFRSHEDSLEFKLPLDIGITGVHIPDTVYSYTNSNPFIFGRVYYFDTLDVEVTNFGEDVVDEFYIESDKSVYCWFCGDVIPIWHIDTVSLSPGESKTIHLGPTTFECYYPADDEFCIYSQSPENMPDDNSFNDKYCVEIRNLIVPSKEAFPDVSFTLYPDPASDELFFQLPVSLTYPVQVEILSLDGKGWSASEMNITASSISIDHIPDGFYFLKIRDSQGHIGVRKFVKQASIN